MGGHSGQDMGPVEEMGPPARPEEGLVLEAEPVPGGGTSVGGGFEVRGAIAPVGPPPSRGGGFELRAVPRPAEQAVDEGE